MWTEKGRLIPLQEPAGSFSALQRKGETFSLDFSAPQDYNIFHSALRLPADILGSQEEGMPNIYDISRDAGVSIATVSRVLNNSPRVSAKTRAKVMAVIESTGYTPNAFAQGLGLRTMKTVGILCADSSDTFFSTVIYHLEEALRKGGYHCILTCTGHELEDKQECVQLLINKLVDAVLILGSTYMERNSKDQAYLLQAADKVPLVLINCFLRHPRIYCVQNDPFPSVYDATRRLLAAEKKRPCFLYQSPNFYNQEKLRGFRAAAAEAGLQDAAIVVQCPQSISDATELLLRTNLEGIDAVVTSHDELAVAFLKYAKRKNLRIPEDCNLIGHGDLLLAECCEPELTTVNLHTEDLCSIAVSHLMQIFDGAEPPHNTVVAGDLHIRSTTDPGIFEHDVMF